MKKKIWLLLIFLLGTTVQAQQWIEDLKDLGLSLISSETLADGSIRGELRTRSDVPMTFILGSGRAGWKDDLQKILTPIENFNFIQIQRMQLILDVRRSEVIFVLSDLDYPQAENLTVHIPSGVYLYLNEEGQLLYSLRMLVDDYVLRVAGEYFDEEILLRRLLTAKADPVKFLRGQDQEFILNLLERIETRLISLEDVVQFMRKAVYAEEGGLADLGTQLDEVDTFAKDLEDELANTRKVLNEADATLSTFLDGSVPLLSKGLGRPRPVDKAAVKVLIETLKEHPQLSTAEVRKKLREERGIKVSTKLVYTVRSLYFGYPESE